MENPLAQLTLTVSRQFYSGALEIPYILLILGGEYFKTHDTKESNEELIRDIRNSLKIDPNMTPKGPPEIKENLDAFCKKGSFLISELDEPIEFNATSKTIEVRTWTFDFDKVDYATLSDKRVKKVLRSCEEYSTNIIGHVEDVIQGSLGVDLNVVIVPENGLQFLNYKPESSKGAPLKINAKINGNSGNRIVDFAIEGPCLTAGNVKKLIEKLAQLMKIEEEAEISSFHKMSFLSDRLQFYPEDHAVEFQTPNSRRYNHGNLEKIKIAARFALDQENLEFELNLDENMKFVAPVEQKLRKRQKNKKGGQ